MHTRTLSLLLFAVLSLALLSPTAKAQPAGQEGDAAMAALADHRVDNLAGLARLYGHVRFFHPSAESVETAWPAFMLYASQRVTHQPDAESLAAVLRELFGPIAPTVEVFVGDAPEPEPPADDGRTHKHWFHYGVEYSSNPNIYRSLIVDVGEEGVPAELHIERGASVTIDLGRGVTARVPLTLPTDGEGRTLPVADGAALARLRAACDAAGIEAARGDDLYARVASVAMAWAVLDHFFPYFDDIEADWDAALDRYLSRALMPQGHESFMLVLSMMMAETRDGHGFVSTALDPFPHSPTARFELVEGDVVVTRTWGDNAVLERGDVVRTVDGVPAEDHLAYFESLTAGSDQLRQHRALNRFASGPPHTPAKLGVERAGEDLEIEAERAEFTNMFFRTPTFEHPGIEEVEPGVWYVNFNTVTNEEWVGSRDEILASEGVIFDYRWGGGQEAGFTILDVIAHAIDEPIETPTWKIPLITHPDPALRQYAESGWTVEPAEPRMNARIAVLTSPSNVSFGETQLSFVRHYELGTLVGAPTAGTNGNVNYIDDLPAKVFLAFTGMLVEKHDGSRLYLDGYEPDVPAAPTLDGIRAGRDEVREAAIRFLTDPG